jgi:hypothetical protein
VKLAEIEEKCGSSSGSMGQGTTQVAAQFGQYEVSMHLAVELKISKHDNRLLLVAYGYL